MQLFRIRHQGWSSWGEDDPYFAEQEYKSPATRKTPLVKTSHLKAVLDFSDEGDAAIMLLDLLAISKNGDWEALFCANWIPGIKRYPSFWPMMLHGYINFLDAIEHDNLAANVD